MREESEKMQKQKMTVQQKRCNKMKAMQKTKHKEKDVNKATGFKSRTKSLRSMKHKQKRPQGTGVKDKRDIKDPTRQKTNKSSDHDCLIAQLELQQSFCRFIGWVSVVVTVEVSWSMWSMFNHMEEWLQNLIKPSTSKTKKRRYVRICFKQT